MNIWYLRTSAINARVKVADNKSGVESKGIQPEWVFPPI